MNNVEKVFNAKCIGYSLDGTTSYFENDCEMTDGTIRKGYSHITRTLDTDGESFNEIRSMIYFERPRIDISQ